MLLLVKKFTIVYFWQRKHNSITSPRQGYAISSGASPSSPCNSPCSSLVNMDNQPNSELAANNYKLPFMTFSITMMTAKWLNTFIAPLSIEPSPQL